MHIWIHDCLVTRLTILTLSSVKRKIAVLIIAVISVLSACGGSNTSLEKEAQRGRFDKILEKVSTRLQKNICDSLTLHGIDLLLDSRNAEKVGWDVIKEQATQCYPTPSGLRIRSALAVKHPAVLDSMFWHTIRVWASDQNLSAVSAVGQGYLGLKTGRMTFVSSLVNISNSIQEQVAAKGHAQACLPRLEREMSNSHLEPINSQSLTAYMIANTGYRQYEIALPEQTYLGRMPSDRHAVLITKQSSFESTGWFTIRVRRLDNSVVKLREEFGSFNQTWPVYEEVSDEEISNYNRMVELVQSKSDSLGWARETIEKADSRIRVLTKNFNTVLACKCDTTIASAIPFLSGEKK
ncbi:MAG: hypothetical protein KDB65_08745 [Calditrichaeota bacterium]|nr:hypothetical protein [Calditrichota bacterium]MCB9367554.1 hypothetical protein [Calditrichota bacterium]